MVKPAKLILSFTLCAVTLFQAPLAQADKQDAGVFLGAIFGGILGNRVGNGDAGATIVGAAIGAVAGGVIGRDLDENDRNEMLRARGDCLERNDRSEWRGRDGYGSMRIIQQGYHHQRNDVVCRSYENTIYYRGRREITRGYACRNSYGNWNEVRETEFSYGGPRHYNNSPQRMPEPMPRPMPPPAYSSPVFPPVQYGPALVCVPGHYGSGVLVNNNTNRQVAVYSEFHACNFALQNQRGPLICIQGQGAQNAFAIDVRTLHSVGFLYRNLQECVGNFR